MPIVGGIAIYQRGGYYYGGYDSRKYNKDSFSWWISTKFSHLNFYNVHFWSRRLSEIVQLIHCGSYIALDKENQTSSCLVLFPLSKATHESQWYSSLNRPIWKKWNHEFHMYPGWANLLLLIVTGRQWQYQIFHFRSRMITVGTQKYSQYFKLCFGWIWTMTLLFSLTAGALATPQESLTQKVGSSIYLGRCMIRLSFNTEQFHHVRSSPMTRANTFSPFFAPSWPPVFIESIYECTNNSSYLSCHPLTIF